MQGGELAVIGACGLAGSQIVLNQSGEQLLGLNQRNLHIAVGVTLQEELLLDALGQDGEYRHGFLGQTVFDKGVLVLPGGQRVKLGGLFTGQQLVDLGNQHGELGNKLHDTLGDDGHAEVPALCGTVCHGIGNVIGNLSQRHLLGSHFLTDQADIGLGLQGGLQCHMGSGAAHDLDEMPVLLGGVGVALDVAHNLSIGLSSGIKAKRALDILVLQVTVNGLGAADHLNTAVMGGKILSQNRRVGVGVIAADDHDGVDAVLLADLLRNRELLLGFQLGSAGADDVKAAGISVLVDVFVIENQIVIFQQTAGAALEAVEHIVLVGGLQCIVQAANHIVAAGGLTAGQDHAHNLLPGRRGVLTLLEGDLVLTVGVGEECLDLLLIGYALGCAAVVNANLGNAVSEHPRELGVILVSRQLQR